MSSAPNSSSSTTPAPPMTPPAEPSANAHAKASTKVSTDAETEAHSPVETQSGVDPSAGIPRLPGHALAIKTWKNLIQERKYREKWNKPKCCSDCFVAFLEESMDVEAMEDALKTMETEYVDGSNEIVMVVKKGEKGEQGDRGEKGDKGDRGDPGEQRSCVDGELVKLRLMCLEIIVCALVAVGLAQYFGLA